ncbi:hypothetical protein GCM10022631_10270 [Deinococcus rubellus]
MVLLKRKLKHAEQALANAERQDGGALEFQGMPLVNVRVKDLEGLGAQEKSFAAAGHIGHRQLELEGKLSAQHFIPI